MARQMNTINGYSRCGGQLSPPALIGIVIAAVIILAVIYLVVSERETEPVPEPLPESERPLETVAPAESAEERGDTAREIIDELRSREGGIDYGAAYDRAQQFRAEARSADALLLYFFAARGGHAPAAFDLAALYDPNHHSGDPDLAEEPDAFQAYRWYRAARDAGHEAAAERIAALRTWAEDAAGAGDAEAERLLLQWENPSEE